MTGSTGATGSTGGTGMTGGTGETGPALIMNMVKFNINSYTQTNPAAVLTTHVFSYGSNNIIRGVNEFTLSAGNTIVTYNGAGGWYRATISTNFSLNAATVSWHLSRLVYNGGIIQSMNPRQYHNISRFIYLKYDDWRPNSR
jgi:hypothetical protein